VYRVRDAATEITSAPPRPPRLVIAVLPFANMSGDPEQEYFADGMVDHHRPQPHPLAVRDRSYSSFTYKGQAVDVKQVGRELGVRYVPRLGAKAGGRVRITTQLIDAQSGAHL
jgi:adenylate cyclase